VTAEINRVLGTVEVTLGFDGAPGHDVRMTLADLSGADPAGLIVRLENRLARLEAHKQDTLAEIARLRGEVAHARDSIGAPFAQAEPLTAARARVHRIDEQLHTAASSPQPEPSASDEEDTPMERVPGGPTKTPERGRSSAVDDVSVHGPPPHTPSAEWTKARERSADQATGKRTGPDQPAPIPDTRPPGPGPVRGPSAEPAGPPRTTDTPAAPAAGSRPAEPDRGGAGAGPQRDQPGEPVILADQLGPVARHGGRESVHHTDQPAEQDRRLAQAMQPGEPPTSPDEAEKHMKPEDNRRGGHEPPSSAEPEEAPAMADEQPGDDHPAGVSAPRAAEHSPTPAESDTGSHETSLPTRAPTSDRGPDRETTQDQPGDHTGRLTDQPGRQQVPTGRNEPSHEGPFCRAERDQDQPQDQRRPERTSEDHHGPAVADHAGQPRTTPDRTEAEDRLPDQDIGEEQLGLVSADQLVALYQPDRSETEPAHTPLLPDDIAAALRRIPPSHLAQLVRHAGGQAPFIRTGAIGGSRTNRGPHQPDPGASEAIDFNMSGIHIRIGTPTAVRAGSLTWPQTCAWLQGGVTPTRRQILDLADEALSRYRTLAARPHSKARRQALKDVVAELERITSDTMEIIVHDALTAHQPDGRPGRPTPYLDLATVRRINEFLAALPDDKPASNAATTKSVDLEHVEDPASQPRTAKPTVAEPAVTRDVELDRGFSEVLQALTDHAGPAALNGQPTSDAFADIKSAFAQLREALDLPTVGTLVPASATPLSAGPGPHSLLNFSDAIAEAHTCAAWYQGAPEWQRITKVTDAAKVLMTTIRETAGDYSAEVRRDIRVRGFTRTLVARLARTVATAADALSQSLNEKGHGHTLAWISAKRLHRAAVSLAAKVMASPAVGSGDRMSEVIDIIADLGCSRRNEESQHHVRLQPELGHSVGVAADAFHVAGASFPRRALQGSRSRMRLVARLGPGGHPRRHASQGTPHRR
jgi:hypothetical protein